MTTIDRLWPLEGAEPWDAPGLVTGDPEPPVQRVLLAVDAVGATVDEAIEFGSDLLIAHHPLLLRGVTSIAEDRYKGALLARLIRADCALLAAHTNADVVERGTSAVLADPARARRRASDRAGRRPVAGPRPRRPPAGTHDARPPGAAPRRGAAAHRDGRARRGRLRRPIETVALCGGAGDSLLGDPAVRAADVYITADLRHHPASEAREQAMVGGGPALIDVSHWASEWLWLDAAAAELRAAHPELDVRGQRAPHRPLGLPGRAMMTTSTPTPTRSTT